MSAKFSRAQVVSLRGRSEPHSRRFERQLGGGDDACGADAIQEESGCRWLFLRETVFTLLEKTMERWRIMAIIILHL